MDSFLSGRNTMSRCRSEEIPEDRSAEGQFSTWERMLADSVEAIVPGVGLSGADFKAFGRGGKFGVAAVMQEESRKVEALIEVSSELIDFAEVERIADMLREKYRG